MKLTLKAISALQFEDVKVFVFDRWRDLLTARALLSMWKRLNPGYDYTTRKEDVDGMHLLYVTIYDHPLEIQSKSNDKPRIERPRSNRGRKARAKNQEVV